VNAHQRRLLRRKLKRCLGRDETPTWTETRAYVAANWAIDSHFDRGGTCGCRSCRANPDRFFHSRHGRWLFAHAERLNPEPEPKVFPF
jgi:hypothetical protein